MRTGLTRRGALGVAALALASCGGDEPAQSGRPAAGSGAGLLNSIVALENAAIAAWAAIAELLDGDARRYAHVIRVREAEHARRVGDLVRELGGAPPSGRPAREYARLFPRMRDSSDALHFARDLEERLVRAYLEALGALPDRGQRAVAAQIAAEEAADLATVHVLAGGAAAPQPFVTGTL